MSAPELFQKIGDKFQEFLHCGLFTTDSIEGWICIFILGFFLWNLGKKALKVVSWSCAIIFLVQIFYWLSFTSLNDYIPLSQIFKYNLLEAIANTVPNSKIQELMMWINNSIHDIITMTWNIIHGHEIQNAIGGMLS